MAQLCQICYQAPASERCAMCKRFVCRGCFSGNGLCKACGGIKYSGFKQK